MFDFLKRAVRPSSYLGVDIGTTSIKMVEVERAAKGARMVNYGILENYGYLKRLNETIQTSSLSIEIKETAALLKNLFEKSGFKTARVIASLPAFSVFITFLELPAMPPLDTAKALKFQIPKYVPLPPQETSIDWVKTDERKDEKGFLKQQILVTAIHNEKIQRYGEIFRMAGLKLEMLEVESLALMRGFAPHVEEPIIIVDIGSQSTNIVVAERGYLRYSIQTDYAGFSLTQALANGLGIDVSRAEDIKKQRGILINSADYELSTLTLPFLDVIISEIKRARAAYEKSGGKAVSRIILAGGGANLPGFSKYMEEQINIRTEVGSPFPAVAYPPDAELIIKELAPVLGLAVGLGIKEFA